MYNGMLSDFTIPTTGEDKIVQICFIPSHEIQNAAMMNLKCLYVAI